MIAIRIAFETSVWSQRERVLRWVNCEHPGERGVRATLFAG